MPSGESRKQYVGEYDPEIRLIVDAGFVRANEVKSALNIINHQIWRRTLAAAGIEPLARSASGRRIHWLRLADARRLLAGARVSKPP